MSPEVSNGRRQRRSFTEDYKRQAVELVVSSRRSITSVAKELGLRNSVLRRWVDCEDPAGAGIGGVALHHAGDADAGGPGFGDRPVAVRRTTGCAWSATF